MTARTRAAFLLAALVIAAPAWPADEPPATAKKVRLQGRASLDRRTHVAGVVVLVQREGDSSRLYLTSTDDDGDFRLDGLPEGDYRVRLERTGFTPVEKNGVRLKFPFRAVVEVTMQHSEDPVADAVDWADEAAQRALAAQGKVVDRDTGQPVAEARVRFIHPEGAANPRLQSTAADGVFEVRELPQGPWELLVDAVGYLGIAVVLDLREDSEIGVVLVRQPASYKPTALELMPPERLIPPEGFDVELVVR